MTDSHSYHRPFEPDSASEDDLDLDELDPAANGDVALKKMQRPASGRLWARNTRSPRVHPPAEDDEAGLLRGWKASSQNHGRPRTWSEDERGWNVKRTRRKNDDSRNHSGAHSRQQSLRASVQLPDFVRQELADMKEDSTQGSIQSREFEVGTPQKKGFPTNVVSNAKYTAWSFLPLTLYNEFRFFLNVYFLLVALSQIIPYLRIGYMSTYIVPLACVLTISIGKEAFDDIARRRRDAEANAELFTVLLLGGRQTVSGVGPPEIKKKSRDLKVGDVLKLNKNDRVPADIIILKSTIAATAISEDEGLATTTPQATSEIFIRTDQLDGETDWKLRLPSVLSQNLPLSDLQKLRISAAAPDRRINEFAGTLGSSTNSGVPYDPHVADVEVGADQSGAAPHNTEGTIVLPTSTALTIDNTAWANTVIASNTTVYAVVVYTGRQTRSALSTAPSRSKTGLLENEINNLTKILCVMTLTLSIILVALEGFEPSNEKPWYVAIMIYLILFSTIIPISLRVNLDMGKTVYAYYIERDKGIPDTVVRTSTIPEDLGRIEYLLSDKTGTLTQNEMQLRKIHVGTVAYAGDAMEEVATYIRQEFGRSNANGSISFPHPSTKTRRDIGVRVRDLVVALAVCHNVTPTKDEVDGEAVISYQASSPDEIAIVEFVESVGLRLQHRDRESITIESVETDKTVIRAVIKDIFPFTSDSKRMGLVVELSYPGHVGQDEDEMWFYQKGADTVMSSIVATNDWLDEETANMAREGLRTLVVGRRRLSSEQYSSFAMAYKDASMALQDRDARVSQVVKHHLEHDLELLGVTGVEDRLQRDVKPSLELLRNAGVKIWMLTGDKVETARCVAISARLVARGQQIHTMAKLGTKAAAQDGLDLLRNRQDVCLLIDGESLALMLTHLRIQFITAAVRLPCVIACRCSPTQKAEVASLIRKHTKKRVCCIGDGGNDVSMIQAADVGIGIVGKEGRQASLAADFSITQFCHITKLIVWHGRNSYKRSAKLGQFIIHRGLIIAVCQTMYNIASKFDPKGLFIDWLLVGYATVYTTAPVFSLVLDRDVDEHLANLYPELYKELKSGEALSYRSFFGWVLVSVYQGIVIQGLSQLLVGQVDGPRMLSVSFTVLILNELIMVAVSVTTWHPIMIASIVGTAAIYAASVPFLGRYFDLEYVVSWSWVWQVAAIAAISLVPVWGGKLIGRAYRPPNYRKVQGI